MSNNKYIDCLQAIKDKWDMSEFHFFKYYLDGRYIHAASLNKHPSIEIDDYALDLHAIIKTSDLEAILAPDPCHYDAVHIYLLETRQFYHSLDDLRKDAFILNIAGVQ